MPFQDLLHYCLLDRFRENEQLDAAGLIKISSHGKPSVIGYKRKEPQGPSVLLAR
jgi:hypothetical protein